MPPRSPPQAMSQESCTQRFDDVCTQDFDQDEESGDDSDGEIERF